MRIRELDGDTVIASLWVATALGFLVLGVMLAR